MKNLENELVNMLKREGKVNSSYISRELGCSDSDVRENVHSLRVKGFPICSDREGYWLGTRHEVNETVGKLRSRALKIFEVCWALERSQEEVFKNQIGSEFDG